MPSRRGRRDGLTRPPKKGGGEGRALVSPHTRASIYRDVCQERRLRRPFRDLSLSLSLSARQPRSLCSSNVADPCLFAAIPLPGWMPLRRKDTEVLPFSGEYSLGKTRGIISQIDYLQEHCLKHRSISCTYTVPILVFAFAFKVKTPINGLWAWNGRGCCLALFSWLCLSKQKAALARRRSSYKEPRSLFSSHKIMSLCST